MKNLSWYKPLNISSNFILSYNNIINSPFSWYKFAKYEDEWKEHIEELAKNNPYPFKHLFPEGSNRLYLPFNIEENQDKEDMDRDVKIFLDNIGCKVVDYRKGLCTIDGKNVLKIGKLIKKQYEKERKDLEGKIEREEIYKPERSIEGLNKFYKDLINTFENSSYRRSKDDSEFYVVISRDPHDVAKMSTDRNWSSCMTLGEGSYYEDVFCEVQEGGLIAYLVKKEDKDIKNPIARIRLRRFENQNGISVLMSEESIYLDNRSGNDVPGFKEFVKKWVNSVQPDIETGNYYLKGGDYSDTFSKIEYIEGKSADITPKTEEDVIRYLNGDVEEDIEKHTHYIVEDQLEPEDIQGDSTDKYFGTLEEAKIYVDNSSYDETWRDYYGGEWAEYDEEEDKYELERYEISKSPTHTKQDFIKAAIKEVLSSKKGKYSEEIILKVKNIMFGEEKTYQYMDFKRYFIEKYPEYLNAEEIKFDDLTNYYDYVSKMEDGEEKRKHISDILNNMREKLSNPKEKLEYIFDRKPNYYRAEDVSLYKYVNDYIENPIKKLINIVPPDIISLIKNFMDEFISMKDKYEYSEKDRLSIYLSVLGRIAMTKTDAPELQRMYKSLLKYWGLPLDLGVIYNVKYLACSYVNINNLGYYISKLGENGVEFLPFIKERLKKTESLLDIYKEKNKINNKLDSKISQMEDIVENHLYVIDAIENGTGKSNKYRFNH